MSNGRSFEGLERLLLWAVVHSVSVWLIGLILPALDVKGLWLNILGTGLGITIFAQIFRVIQYRIHFEIDWRFFYWFVVHTFGFWVMINLVPRLEITNRIFAIIITGIGIAVIDKLATRIKIGNLHEIPWWTIIIIGVAIIIALTVIRVPYATREISGLNVECKDGTMVLKSSMFGLGDFLHSAEAALTCPEYKSSVCRNICTNGRPACQCEATLWDQWFTQPGEWIIDLFR